VFRFGASLQGRWTGRTKSPHAALNGLEFVVQVGPSSNPARIGWSGPMAEKPNAWAHQHGPGGKLRRRTPVLVMMPDVRRWHSDLPTMRRFVREFRESHGFNGGHISTIGQSWFDADAESPLEEAGEFPDVRTFAALEAAASEWAGRGGWLHVWMWGKREGDFSKLPGGFDGARSRRLNRYIAARLGPVPGWSMGIGWDVEFWADEKKLKWWLDDLVPNLGWHHWLGFRYSDSDIGRGRDPEPANRGEYLARGLAWSALRPAREQYAGWEHWATMTTDAEIDAALAAFPDRPVMSEDRFRSRENGWKQKDLRTDEDVVKEIPRWASRGVGAIYGRLTGPIPEASDAWPNSEAIKAAIQRVERLEH
jgi:hypothetical protein